MTATRTARVAYAEEFVDALAKLAPPARSKVHKTVLKFHTDVDAGENIAYDPLSGLADKNMRLLPVDQEYRIVLSAPEQGDIYLFLWVGQSDQARQWAAGHQCKINPDTGTLQLYATRTEVANRPSVPADQSPPLFAQLQDRQLLKLGVPKEQLALVRAIRHEDDLDRAQSLLPQEVYEALCFYGAGESYEDILRERELQESEFFDAANYSDALDRPQSKNRFTVPADDTELLEILNASLEKWRVFLHSSQRKLASGAKNGPVRVLGGAGTGKTVVAMHRAKWLAAHSVSAGKKVLFTTFTKNLAIDIARNLKSICIDEEFNKIEVINLDQWTQGFLHRHNYDYRVVFDHSLLRELWQMAYLEKPASIEFDEAFFKEEWQKVIQPQGIRSLDDYKKASRIGRGTRLSRKQRLAIWPVFAKYRHQLNQARYKEVDDAYRDAAELIDAQGIKLAYSSVIVDEAQDMGTQAFRLIRSIVAKGQNDLFIVGDAHQRIYGRNRVVLRKCGIDILGRAHKLKINYRTTEEIRRRAASLLEGRDFDDLDGGLDSNSLYKSLTHGNEPLVQHFQNFDQQAEEIKNLLDKDKEHISHFCVVARTNREVEQLQRQLENLNLKTALIKPNQPEINDSGVIKLATMHRVKGLEFDVVILASINAGLVPYAGGGVKKSDAVSREETETEERSLVYVAMTRARKSVYVFSYGDQSKFFSPSTSTDN